jgi:hypothetical protein
LLVECDKCKAVVNLSATIRDSTGGVLCSACACLADPDVEAMRRDAARRSLLTRLHKMTPVEEPTGIAFVIGVVGVVLWGLGASRLPAIGVAILCFGWCTYRFVRAWRLAG